MYFGNYYIDVQLVLRVLVLLAMGTGLVVVPILPGLVIIWAAALIYGILTGFNVLAWIMFGIITVLMIAGSTLDNVLMGAKAHKEGAPWWVVLVSMVGLVAGNFIIPIPIGGGIIVGLVVLYLLQFLRLKNGLKALNSLKGMLIGWGWAFVFRFIIGLVMIGLWLIWAWA